MKKGFLTLVLCLLTLSLTAQINRPKLVVGLIVDQMRWDYLYYYYNQYSDGGFKRLVDEGYNCQNCMLNYVPSVTGAGHASIFTGTVPALNGIVGNSFMLNDKWVNCCTDTTVISIGSNTDAGKRSPRNMLSTTIGDQLKLATDFKSKVIGIALKDRAAIFPAGHAADAAYWWDMKAGHFISSSYYMAKLPQWVVDFNKKNHAQPNYNMLESCDGVTTTFKMAKTAIENEQLGQDAVTDMLTISISSTDAIAHKFSTRGKENRDVFMRTDKELAQFLQYLDEKVGKGNYILFLSADHGGVHNPNQMTDRKIPAGYWDSAEFIEKANEKLKNKYGIDQVIVKESSSFIFLNHPAVRKAKADIKDIKKDIVSMLSDEEEIIVVTDCSDVSSSTMPAYIKERITNGYYPNRNGDIYLVLKSNYFEWKFDDNYKGTTHSMWNPYDQHIPFIIYGWNVKPGETNKPVEVTDIATTICSMLKIQMPNAAIGHSIFY